jgi:hypothetical protein
MREVHFFIPAILALCLGGCASGANSGICARFSDPHLSTPTSNFAPLRKSPNLHHRSARKRTLTQVPAVAIAAVEAPEPRVFSAEWWARENARVNKALVICRDCEVTVGANITRVPKNDLIFQPKVQVKTELFPTEDTKRFQDHLQ